MDWPTIVTNIGIVPAIGLGLARFTQTRLDKYDAQWEARAAEWREEKKALIERIYALEAKIESNLSQIAKASQESIDRSTQVMQECLRVMKDIKKG